MPGADWLDADMLGALAAIGSVLITGLGLLGGAIKWADSRQERRQREQHTQLTQMAEMLAAANHQLHPNSGKSLADSVNRIEERVSRMADDLDHERKARAQDDSTIRSELDRLGQSAVREHRSIWDAITGGRP